jgi:hypothetical protein
MSLGTMGLINQDSDEDGLPLGIGVNDNQGEDESDEDFEIRRFKEYMEQTPGYGADGYSASQNNNREYFGLGPIYSDEAIKCAEEFTKETFYTEYEKPTNPDTFHISIEVETVVGDPEDEDGGTMNIGTVFQKTIYLTSHNDFIEPIYFLMPHNDYEVLEDNTLKIKRKPLLADVNKNDIIEVAICDTPEAALHPTVLKYKVVSKVIYEDGDYYHCELLI